MNIKNRLRKYKSYAINLLVPSIVFGFVTGTLTAITVTLYKLCAKYVVIWSTLGYEYIREHLYLIPVAALILAGVSCVYSLAFKKTPNIKGGGIPNSIGILRGVITFKWLRSLVGVFTLSLTSFLMGVPLGTEGPSVLMGTAVGRGSVRIFATKHRAWDRYSMTGGACAGFSVATGAPISGIMFAIEEAHQRISPTIMTVASFSVLFANIASKLISPLVGVSEGLFQISTIDALEVKEYWLPLVIGLALGLFSVAFLYYHRFAEWLFHKCLKKLPRQAIIFAVLLLTFIMGLVSTSFVSTGHELIIELFENRIEIVILALALIVRTVLTLSANVAGATGGIFIPILAIGGALSSLLGNMLISWGLDSELYTAILVLGITASIAGSMKMPLTAIIFAIEALSLDHNIVPVIIAALVAFLVTELFGMDSINDVVLEMRLNQSNKEKSEKTIETFVTVRENTFAVGKQIRDIFWPSNLFVLSLKHRDSASEVDEHGGKELKEGDVLHVRYSTQDEEQTRQELYSIVGEQKNP